MRLNTARDLLKVPSTSAVNSISSSATPSPTLSTQESRVSAGFSTSVSDLDDYVDRAMPQTVTPAPMKARSTTSSKPSPEPGRRRASGRLRKPTAKAQAISEEKTSPSQLLDTIVIGGSPPRKPEDDTGTDDRPSTPPPPPSSGLITAPDTGAEVEIPETPAQLMNDSTTYINGEGVDDTPPPSPTTNSATRRHSRRERKPTAKVLETSPITLKRPASDVLDVPDAHDSHEEPRRKSARVSYAGARVPSKLRYSVSSTSTEAPSPSHNEMVDPVPAPAPAPTPGKKSNIVILKIPRLAEVFKIKAPRAVRHPKIQRNSPRRTRNSTGRQKVGAAVPKKQAPIRSIEFKEPAPSCLLSCLSPTTRLLAMAQIALMMPDSNDDDEMEVISGSDQDWRTYVPQLCQCRHNQDGQSSRTNSVDLQRALEPNLLSDGTQFAPIEVSSSPTPESDFLAAPVNTILKVGEAQRVKELFYNNATMSVSNSFSTPGHGARNRKRASMPLGTHLSEDVSAVATPGLGSLSVPAKSSYEERLRKDHLALSDIRKRAGMMGIRWSFNMTFDQIHDQIMQVEAQEEQGQVRSQTRPFGHRMISSSYDHEEAAPHSPYGFGVLMPSEPLTNGMGNGESSLHGHAPSGGRKPRRPVDPRGLLGESPGPGTIISLENKRRAGGRAAKRSRIS